MDKIAKLNTMADPLNGATENEVAICNAQIKKLLGKHNLSMAQILQKKGEPMKMEEGGAPFVSAYSKWEQLLHGVIAKVCGVRPFYSTRISYGKQKTMIVFVGTATDVAVALKMYEYLRLTVIRLSRNAARNESGFSGNCYRLGVVVRLRQRAEEAAEMDTPEEQAAYGALVVVKDKQLDEYMKKKDLQPSRSRGVRIEDHHSYRKGLRDGEIVDLGRSNRLV